MRRQRSPPSVGFEPARLNRTHPMSSTIYSDRLGAISDAQFAAATQRLGLGKFLSAAPTSAGLFGQNVFVTTDAGQYVLRGAPHWVKRPDEDGYHPNDRWQFTKEAWFARRLHEETSAPAPWPYLLDDNPDIFGWPYGVMPRMPGECFVEYTIAGTLGPEDRRAVAAAAGTTLAELQRLTSPFAGDFDVDTVEMTADPAGNVARMAAQTRRLAAAAERQGMMTTGDLGWIEDAVRVASNAGDRPNTFQHTDYKLNNMTMVRDGSGWRVGGVFDLHTAQFGDGAYDLARMACAYLDTDRECAGMFVDAWRAGGGGAVDLSAWMPLYVISDRVIFWQFFSRDGARPEWSVGKTFRQWAERYLERVMGVL